MIIVKYNRSRKSNNRQLSSSSRTPSLKQTLLTCPLLIYLYFSFLFGSPEEAIHSHPSLLPAAAFWRFINLIMADLSKYSSERLMKANEKELQLILKEYKAEHMPPWKFGMFVGYNAVALSGMYFYGVKLRGKRVEPSLKNNKQLTIPRLFSKGVQHGVVHSLVRPS
jgi:hypothetical protein